MHSEPTFSRQQAKTSTAAVYSEASSLLMAFLCLGCGGSSRQGLPADHIIYILLPVLVPRKPPLVDVTVVSSAGNGPAFTGHNHLC